MSFWDLFGDDPAGIDCPPILEQTDGAIIAPEDSTYREPGTETPGPTLGRQGRLNDFMQAANTDVLS